MGKEELYKEQVKIAYRALINAQKLIEEKKAKNKQVIFHPKV